MACRAGSRSLLSPHEKRFPKPGGGLGLSFASLQGLAILLHFFPNRITVFQTNPLTGSQKETLLLFRERRFPFRFLTVQRPQRREELS